MADTAGKVVMVVGRIVWVAGDLFKGSPKLDFNTKAPKLDAMGQPMMEYGFGLAVTKQQSVGNPGISEIWPAIYEEAYTLYPSRQLPPAFALKMKDGDTDIDDKGIPFNQRKGYPGCMVLACKTSIPIKWFRHENGQNIMINDGIKCGDYVQVQLSVKAHGAIGAGKPGMYLNPNAVLFAGYGEAIVNQPSGDQIFGSAPPPLPPGASATPFMQQGFVPPVAQPAYAPPQAPAWGQPPPQAPAAPPQPHYGVLPPQHQPQAPVAPPMAQPQYAPPAAPAWQPPQAPAPQAGGFPPMPGMPR